MIKYFDVRFIYYSYLANWVAGLDFNPSGEIVGTIDGYGKCVVSEVNTNGYRFHMSMGKQGILIIQPILLRIY